ncbi:MAG: hypothetical protein GY809_15680 [Planctomycetes bacterium]|nr:hypothetical protein [Planctomycetota bacterium]
MRILCVLLVVACTLIMGCSKSESENTPSGTPAGQAAVEESLIYYTCPMESHKHVHSSEPGTCSECPMALVKAVTTSEEKMEFYGCPMESHSHIRRDESGTCTECSMELKPMRLDKTGT